MCYWHTFHYTAHIFACHVIFCALLMHFVPRSNDVGYIGVKVLNSPDGQVKTYQFILLKLQRWWSTVLNEARIQCTQDEVCSDVSYDTYKSIWAVPYIVICAWQMPVWFGLELLDLILQMFCGCWFWKENLLGLYKLTFNCQMGKHCPIKCNKRENIALPRCRHGHLKWK
jgi:hypothetical protein